MEITGRAAKFLRVDLSGREWSEYPVSEKDQRLYLGGKGLAVKIYYDLMHGGFARAEALSPENPVIFSLGVLLGTKAPCSARFEVLTRSPLTGLLTGSSCGGPFGEALRTAGWDGLIVQGASAEPLILRISAEGAAFEDGAELWGMETGEAQEALHLTAKEGAALIGPAGENGVLYANMRSGHRFAGRGGIGAVLGAKKLKALVCRGWEVGIRPQEAEAFRRAAALAKKRIGRNPMTLAHRDYGTASLLRPGLKSGYTPARNFRDPAPPQADSLSGEAMAERYGTRHSTCRHCTILCGHKGTYPDGVTRQIPEYETVGMLGANIGNFDPDLAGLWNERLNNLGMDTISAGSTIAWAMEAAEKGIRKSALRFGDCASVSSVIEDIAFRRNEGEELADGTMRLSRRFGGEDFAIQVKGLECAAYDPRAAWGQGLSYAVYNKGGCHLGSYLVGLERVLNYMPPRTTLGKPEWVVFCEDLYMAVNSLQICQFTTYGILTEPPIPKFVPRFILRALTIITPRMAQLLMDWSVLSRLFSAITGIRVGKLAFLKAGERSTKLERWINLQMSREAAADTLPARFTAEGESPVPLERMVRRYYRLRRYSPEGVPDRGNLEKLMEEKLYDGSD
jgi:aldehyde:ferredoxin oxidoreductase